MFSMGAEGQDYLVTRSSRRDGDSKLEDLEMIMEEDHITESFSSSSSSSLFSPSFGDASATLSASEDTVTSAEDLLEDSATSSSSESSIGAPGLFDLSELMSQLPIKRGLSKFYPGKSQSFTSLARVTSLEDLAKKGYSGGYGRRIKSCKSFSGGLNTHLNSSSIKVPPKPTISKKSFRCSSPSKGGALSLSCSRRNVTNISRWNASNSGKPPVSPVHIE